MSQEELEGRGFIFNFFHYLWLKDPLNQHQKVQIYIPDTVCYKYGKPNLWYFSNKEGSVQRRNKDKLNKTKIKESFLQNQPQSKIIAYFVHFLQKEQGGDNYIQLQYMNETQFIQFIDTEDYNREGYLQKFIQPTGNFNNQIKVTWGQEACFFQFYESNIPVNDTKYDIYQRALLSENLKSNCQEKALPGKILSSRLETLCSNIACHIQNVTNFRRKVIHMESVFKLGKNDQVTLLYCEGIKTNVGVQKELRTITRELTIPDNINQQYLPYSSPQLLDKTMQCFHCSDSMDINSTFDIPLSMIIKAWKFDHISLDNNKVEQEKLLKKQQKMIESSPKHNQQDIMENVRHNNINKQDNNINEKNGNSYNNGMQHTVKKNCMITEILKQYFPKMTEKEFNNPENYPSFVQIKIPVCQNCYLLILDSSNRSENVVKLAKYHQSKAVNPQVFSQKNLRISYSSLVKNRDQIQQQKAKTFKNNNNKSSLNSRASTAMNSMPKTAFTNQSNKINNKCGILVSPPSKKFKGQEFFPILTQKQQKNLNIQNNNIQIHQQQNNQKQFTSQSTNKKNITSCSQLDMKTEANLTTKYLKTEDDESTFLNENKFMSIETDRLPQSESSQTLKLYSNQVLQKKTSPNKNSKSKTKFITIADENIQENKSILQKKHSVQVKRPGTQQSSKSVRSSYQNYFFITPPQDQQQNINFYKQARLRRQFIQSQEQKSRKQKFLNTQVKEKIKNNDLSVENLKLNTETGQIIVNQNIKNQNHKNSRYMQQIKTLKEKHQEMQQKYMQND